MIVEYINNGVTGQRIGVFVAYPNVNGKHYNVGWSICNPLDKFDRNFGRQLATNRAGTWFNRYYRKVEDYKAYPDTERPNRIRLKIKYSKKIDERFRHRLSCFLERCDKYYKGLERPEYLERFVRKDKD